MWFFMGMKRLRAIFLAGIIGCSWLSLSGCSTVPVTGRNQLNVISPGQEMQLGLTAFEEMKKETPVSRDPAINAMVQRVGKRIAAVADLPDAQWEFVVFDSKEANAFCLPGGKVGVYTGILPITKDEEGMATVIGHEVAHAAAHHGGERMTRAMATQVVGEVASGVAGQYGAGTQAAVAAAYGLGAQLGVVLPHSRKQETEADHIGLVYMARAGYNPESAIAFWQRFSEFNQAAGGPPWFLRTHPVDEVRIEQLKELMPKAKREYRAHR